MIIFCSFNTRILVILLMEKIGIGQLNEIFSLFNECISGFFRIMNMIDRRWVMGRKAFEMRRIFLFDRNGQFI